MIARMNCGIGEEFLPNANQRFEIRIETNDTKLFKSVDKALSAYKDGKHGATIVLLQSNIDETELKQSVPMLDEFALVKINVVEK